MGLVRCFSQHLPGYFVSISFLRGASQVDQQALRRGKSRTVILDPHVFERECHFRSKFPLSHQLNRDPGWSSEKSLEVHLLWGTELKRNPKETLEIQVLRFHLRNRNEQTACQASFMGNETFMSGSFLVSCSLGCTQETIPEKSVFRFFQIFVFQLLP